ncbi:MAG: 50S ribosomal protein L11 methyltransferase [Clostridia bacterium]|nr:50S ribosomal protein L11 methyltransferase [Clostridia bacterium]
MQYRKLTLTLPHGQTDEVAGRLSLLGFTAFEIEDYSDLESEEARRFYDYIDDDLLKKQNDPPRIHFYFYCDPEGEDAYRAFLECMKTPEFSAFPLDASLEDDEEWKDKWKEFFRPFSVGKRLFVYPPWEEEVEIPKGRLALLMDPSAAFGSGTHATTRLCMECAEDYLTSNDAVLDLGCGSGILALAALKLGATHADAVDIEESAVRVCRDNCALNGISEKECSVRCGDATRDPGAKGAYTFVFANLVASLIVAIAPSLFELLRDGGTLVASGILNVRCEETLAALQSAGLTLVECREEEEWCALVMKKEG